MTFSLLVCVKLFLILTVCSQCRCIEVSIPEAQYEVARGSDIALPCSFIPAKTNYDMFILRWEIVHDNKPDTIAVFYSNLNRVDISPEYESRASLNVDATTLTSELHLTKVTMEDNGNYQCNVNIPGDDEGTPSASTFVLVLVPPSAPLCTIQGEAEYWNNISLTCKSAEGSPQPSYAWNSYSINNSPRSFPPKTTEKDGVLSLFNISRETSGYFVCTSANRIGSASCNFTLAVMPRGSMSGATAGIIGGVVAALLILGIIIFFYCRRKNKKAKYTEGAPGEMEFGDMDDAEASSRYKDDKPQINHEKDILEQNRTIDMNSEAEGHKYRDDDRDQHRGSRDRLDDDRDQRRGSRDRLDDDRDQYGSSRDRRDENRDQYRGSRDRLDDNRDQYRGSRDRLDDNRDQYRGSRDRLDDNRDQYRGSRDRRDDDRDQYRGSRDRLDDNRDQYRGSRDRLDDNRDQYRGSRDRLDDNRDYGSHYPREDYRGSRDRLNDSHRYGSRDNLDYSESGRYD